MYRRSLALLFCVLVVAARGAGRRLGGPNVGARRDRAHPSRRQTYTDGAQCTANFVFFDAADVYIGQAAHCSGTGGATETDGCTGLAADRHARRGRGASRPGTMVYNSWLAMQAKGETDPDTCAYNDFALVKLDPADARQGQPVGPVLGRPERGRRDHVSCATRSTPTATRACAGASRS